MTLNVQADRGDALPAGLRIAVDEQGTTTTLLLEGEWGLAEQEASRRAVDGAFDRAPARVIVDLSGLTFIDSSGVHVLIEIVRRAARQSVQLVIVPGSRAVQRVFEVCQLIDRLPFRIEP
jgi:anti-sigma B factor antagonist